VGIFFSSYIPVVFLFLYNLCFFTIIGALFALWLYYLGRTSFFSNREKASVFECGFDVKKNSHFPLSLRFFFVLLVFLVFDIEITLLLQLPLLTELIY
jgi:NADH-ubiquinone oxidoreductase chain 3